MSLMRQLFKNVGGSSKKQDFDPSDQENIKRILISRPNNRLGNLLLTTPLVQELSQTFPDSEIDMFVRGNLAPIIFQNYKNVKRFYRLPKKPFKKLPQYLGVWTKLKSRRYDLVINVVNYSSSGRLSTQFASSKYKIFGNIAEVPKGNEKNYKHMAQYPVFELRNFLKFSEEKKSAAIPVLNLNLDENELSEGKKLLKNLVKNEKKNISIFTHATGSKCYSQEWWEAFYAKLLSEFPDHNIVEVLPVENVSKLSFKAPAFYSKNIREIGAFIANTEVFIGADSGIMHLASAAKAPTVGLFSVTDEKKYFPYNKGSFAVNTNEKDQSEIIEMVQEFLKKVKKC